MFTAERSLPWTDAVAFDEAAIVAVGTTEHVRAASPDARVIDVEGRTVVPGFIDAHNHYLATGESLASIDVRFPTVASVEGLIRAVAETAEATPPGETIRAFGLMHQDAPGARLNDSVTAGNCPA